MDSSLLRQTLKRASLSIVIGVLVVPISSWSVITYYFATVRQVGTPNMSHVLLSDETTALKIDLGSRVYPRPTLSRPNDEGYDSGGEARYPETELVRLAARKLYRVKVAYPESIGWMVDAEASGFPLPAMASFNVINMLPDDELTTAKTQFVEKAQELKTGFLKRGRGTYSLPLRPLPLGFAVNTLFYAALILIPWELLAWARRARRRTRGLCARCAHSLAGLPDAAPCPECGTPAPRCPPSTRRAKAD